MYGYNGTMVPVFIQCWLEIIDTDDLDNFKDKEKKGLMCFLK